MMRRRPSAQYGWGVGMAKQGWRASALVLMAIAAIACKTKPIELPEQVVSSIAVTVWPEVDDAGLDGSLQQAFGTAFQAAPWQRQFFESHPDQGDPTASPLLALGPSYVRVQAYDSPERSSVPLAWDFTELDAIVQPLLKLGVPVVLQILADDLGQRDTLPAQDHLAAFAAYCANIVSYYNGDAGLALDDGGTLRSDARRPILWWSLLGDVNNPSSGASTDEPSLGSLYGQMYNQAVGAMLAVDPRLQFVAPDFNDCNDIASQCALDGGFLDSFLAVTANGLPDGGRTPIHALSLHMFSTATALAPGFVSEKLQLEPDLAVLATVAAFGSDAVNARDLLRGWGRSDTQLWITQNQVNSDTPSNDTPPLSQHSGGKFVADARGTSAFFAAWRPYMFSQLARAGSQALFQWQYTAGRCPGADASCSLSDAADTDTQNAEVNYDVGSKYLSYWVDFALAHKFPPDAGLSILRTSPDPLAAGSDLEVLAAERADAARSTTVVMVVNHAVDVAGTAFNGTGAARQVVVDLSKIVPSGSWSVSELVVDGNTDRDAGPREVLGAGVPPGQTFVPIHFSGYGVAFLTMCSPACAP